MNKNSKKISKTILFAEAYSATPETVLRLVQQNCEHSWEEQPGEPPVDVCVSCGLTRT